VEPVSILKILKHVKWKKKAKQDYFFKDLESQSSLENESYLNNKRMVQQQI
jgi:hypothetical protein